MSLTYCSWKKIEAEAGKVVFDANEQSYSDYGIQAQNKVNIVIGGSYTIPFSNNAGNGGKAIITGDNATFVGVADDKLKVIVNNTQYDNIDVSTATSLSDVAFAINAIIDLATASVDINLVITGDAVGGNPYIEIGDGTSTNVSCIERLFSVASLRKNNGATDIPPLIERITIDLAVGLIWWRGYGQGEGRLKQGYFKYKNAEEELENLLKGGKSLYKADGIATTKPDGICGYPDNTYGEEKLFEITSDNLAGKTEF